jgi:N-methylhydantoinase A
MLAGGLRADVSRTVLGPLSDVPLEEIFGPLTAQVLPEVGGAGTVSRFLGLRYRGQEHTLEVQVPAGAIDQAQLTSAFERASVEAYSFRLDSPLEMVSARVSATVSHWPGPSATAPLAPVAWAEDAGTGRPSSVRTVDFDAHGGPLQAAAVSRASVQGWLPGPCLVEEPAATTLVLPGQAVSRDGFGNLIIEERQ